MAQLRGTGSAIVQLYIQDMMQRQRQAENQAAIAQRGREQDAKDFAQSVLGGIQEGKYRPEAFSPAISQLIGQFYDPNKMAPSLDERVGRATAPFLAKTNFQDIPDDESYLESLTGSGVNPIGPDGSQIPEVQKALKALAARRDSLRGFIPTKTMPFVDKNGIKQSQETPVNEIASYGALPQERTPEQEGNRALRTDLANKYSPEATAATITQTNAVNTGTQKTEASKAGAISNAQAMGANADNVNTQKFDLFGKEQGLLHGNAVDLENTRQANRVSLKDTGGANNPVVPLILFNRVKTLSDNLGDRNIVGRMSTGIKSYAGLDTNARDLDDAAQGGGIAIAQLLGNKGAISEADAAAGQAYFPRSHQPKALRDRKLARLEQLVKIAPLINAMGQGKTLAEKMAIADQMIKQDEAGRGLPGLEDDMALDPRVGDLGVQ